MGNQLINPSFFVFLTQVIELRIKSVVQDQRKDL